MTSSTRYVVTLRMLVGPRFDTRSQMPWADVKKEMTDEKGLDPATADKIGEYVKHKGMVTSGPLQHLCN